MLMSNPNTLLEVIGVAPAENIAIVLPEAGIRVTYKQLRDQVTEMADALASMGIGRGDRVATYLPNGLPAIVSFLAASVAGTAAPLNPGYREDEVNFYLEDTGAKVLLCPADATAARKAAEARGVPVYALEMDGTGYVRIAGAPQGKKAVRAGARRYRADPAHQWQHGTPEARADHAQEHGRLDAQHRGALCAGTEGRLAVRYAAVPCARAGGFDAFDAALGRNGGGAG